MDLLDALKLVRDEGKKITRIGWYNPEQFIAVQAGALMISIQGVYHAWLISEADLFPRDWILVEEAVIADKPAWAFPKSDGEVPE